MKLKDYILYALIIVLGLVIYFKPSDEIKDQQKDYDSKFDSLTAKIEAREVVEQKTINNVTNNIIENNTNKVWYSQSDSLRLHFIDSVFRVEGL